MNTLENYNRIEKLKRRWTKMNIREEQKIWQKKAGKRQPINKTKISRQKNFFLR